MESALKLKKLTSITDLDEFTISIKSSSFQAFTIETNKV